LAGLRDCPRSGKPKTYDEVTERRLLALIDTPPPEGYSQWNGRLLAESLGDVSDDQVWRLLRKHKIQLQRRRSWCISTDPEFGAKAADVVWPEYSIVRNRQARRALPHPVTSAGCTLLP
jgi:DNA polymerase III psi subunit